MPVRLLTRSSRIFDRLEARWDTLATQRWVATGLTLVFLFGMAIIEAKRRGWLSPGLAEHLPNKHFDAILWAFTLLLLAEVCGCTHSGDIAMLGGVLLRLHRERVGDVRRLGIADLHFMVQRLLKNQPGGNNQPEKYP